MKTYTVGQLAFLDTIASGLVPCRVLSISPGLWSGRVAAPTGEIRVVVTKKQGAYPKGIEQVFAASHVIPKGHVIHRALSTSINVDFEWKGEAK